MRGMGCVDDVDHEKTRYRAALITIRDGRQTANEARALATHALQDGHTVMAAPMPSVAGEDDAARGLYGKYRIERTNGSSGPGGKHEHCRYFVLDLRHDKHAGAALVAYAESCKAEYPQLAEDLGEELCFIEHEERLSRARKAALSSRKALDDERLEACVSLFDDVCRWLESKGFEGSANALHDARDTFMVPRAAQFTRAAKKAEHG